MTGGLQTFPDWDSPARIGYHFLLAGVLIFPCF
jgi:hypothetical protein